MLELFNEPYLIPQFNLPQVATFKKLLLSSWFVYRIMLLLLYKDIRIK